MKSQRYLFAAATLPGNQPVPKRARTQQRSASQLARLFKHLLIRASAGTGKTYRLSNRFLQLLIAGAPVESILASTFTRKAAGEILDRVLVRLAKAASDQAACRELADQLGESELAPERCLELLLQLVRNLHRLRIGTLDAFFVQVAQSFSLELGLPPFWRIADPLDDTRLRGVAIESLLRDGARSELVTLVHLLTKGEAQRNIGKLMRDTVESLYELFLETDRQAWHRLQLRKGLEAPQLEELLDRLASFPLTNSLDRARQADYQRACAEDWEQFVEKGIAANVAAGKETYGRAALPPELIEIYQSLVGHARAALVYQLAMQTQGAFAFLERFHVTYKQLKQQQRCLCFDDVTRQLAQQLGDRQSPAWADFDQLAFRLDGRIDHLLLDEFQDTSLAQWLVLQPLAGRVTAKPDGSFFCVGDVKQAIYGWRGGNSELFEVIGQQLADIEHEPLNTSYRSAPPVIAMVNRVFGGLTKHPSLGRCEEAVQAWCEAFPKHETVRKDLPGYVCLETADCLGKDSGSVERTLRYAANQVAQMHQHCPQRSIGVLVRKNEAVARVMNELQMLGVRASQEGGNPLTDSAAVRLILSALLIADHPGHTIARFHVAHSPLAELLGLADAADGLLAERVAQQIRREILEHGYGAVVLRWARTLVDCASHRDATRLEQLIELAYTYQEQATLRPSHFVRYVEAQKVMDPSAANVRVMTVHQAKGLQFDIVFLPELDLQLVGQNKAFVADRPHPTAKISRVCRYAGSKIRQLLPAEVQAMFPKAVAREVAESLCLLYVALTRAVHAVHMIIPASAENERQPPCTLAGLLRVALKDAQPVERERVVFYEGNPRWYAEQSVQPDLASSKELAQQSEEAPPLRLAPMEGGRRRGWQRQAPSALEGGRRVRMAELVSRQSAAARLRGTILHKWFEQIDWLEEGLPDDDALRQCAAASPDLWLPEQQIDELLKEFKKLLDQPEIQKVLSRTGWLSDNKRHGIQRIEIRKEWPFAVRLGDQLLSGSIDRLVLGLRGDDLVRAEVIDFKTDLIQVSDKRACAGRVEFYRPQLDAYAAAVAHALRLPLDHVSKRLVFVSAGVSCSL